MSPEPLQRGTRGVAAVCSRLVGGRKKKKEKKSKLPGLDTNINFDTIEEQYYRALVQHQRSRFGLYRQQQQRSFIVPPHDLPDWKQVEYMAHPRSCIKSYTGWYNTMGCGVDGPTF